MNLDQIATKCFILALFIRDDGQRLLLGDGYYDFNQKLQHFQANTIANDIVEIQGDNGQLLAGQVMRSGAQKFEGYIGDATTNRQIIEQKRSDFMAFFRIKHFYKVIYIFPDGTAIQRQRGYLTDAPTIPEIFQKFPEYSVALNFEDANYYEYAEDEHGDEIYAHIIELALSGNATGGLVWDAIGAVTNGITWSGIQTAQGEYIQVTNDLDIPAKLASVEMLGKAEQAILPSEYQQIAYIEAINDGTSQRYINTGVQLGSNDFEISCDVKFLTGDGYEKPILSIWTSSFGYWNLFKVNNNLDCYTSGHHYINNGAMDDTRYDVSLKRAGNSWTMSNGVDADTTWTYTPSDTNNTTLKINTRGDINDTGKTTSAQYYGITIKVGTGVVRNYIPAIRKSDNAVGLYDTINGTFNPSVLDAFIAGDNAPTPDAPMPISTTTGENVVKIEGKNLLGESHDNYGINGSDGSVMQIAGRFALVARVQEGQAYTTSRSAVGTSTYFWAGFFAEKPVIGSQSITFADLGASTLQRTLTAPSGAKYCAIFYGAGTSPDCQLELGSTATTYEPYQGQEFTIDLGSIELAKIGNYQDRIYKDSGKWYIEKQVGKVVLDGTETGWGYNSNRKVFWGFNSDLLPNSGFLSTTTGYWAKMSDNFTYHAQGGNDATLPDGLYENTSTTSPSQLLFHYSAITSLADWKTWLSTHNTTVYYALATPTTTEITNEALIAQLDALGASSLYVGLNNIGTETQNAVPTLKIEYYTEYTLDGAGYEWEPGGNTAKTIVTVAGVDSAWPIWTVQGGAQNPTLTNITTGQTITWQGFVPEGQTLTINMAEMTADLAGANVFEYITGEWIRLAPGNNTLVYTAGSADKPSTLSWNGVLA